jgi:enoyl-CoA hydratase/carnithine racemase
MSAILYDVTDGIATITINRPEKRNAMSFAVLGEFIEATKRAGADDGARVVIVTGAGGAFCAAAPTRPTVGGRSWCARSR